MKQLARTILLVLTLTVLSPAPTRAYFPVEDSPPPRPLPPTSAETCARMAPGLAVLSIEPVLPLIWVKEERAFRVGICNSGSGPTPNGGLVAYITLDGQSHPTAQTYTTHGAIPPGYSEIILEHWIPGLENHVTICVQKPVVIVEVKWSDDGRNDFRPLKQERMNVACGGDYA